MNSPDRILLAAQGYQELGMYRHALQELALLPRETQEGADSLEIKALSLMGLRRWDEALPVANTLRRLRPAEAGGYIHSAYCLHELGRTQEALDMLVSGPQSLRERSIFFYNVACYQARLGQLETALQTLRKSFDLDPSLRKSARRDHDLEALWSKF